MSLQSKKIKIDELDVSEDFLQMMRNKLDLDMPFLKTEITIMKGLIDHFIDLEFS